MARPKHDLEDLIIFATYDGVDAHTNFVAEVADSALDIIRGLAAVSAEVPDGHTRMTDGITPSEPTEWLEDLNAVSAEKEGDT